MKVKPSKH